MSVSDESGETSAKPKRVYSRLTEDQWNLARIQFESGDAGITLIRIAAIFNTSRSSVEKRSCAEKWMKGQKLIVGARKSLQAAMEPAIQKAAENTAAQISARLVQDLAPWIEKEKRAHIKRAIKRSKSALKRLDRVANDGYRVYDSKLGKLVDVETGPKDEMHIASAEDKYDGIIRRNLGMSENNSVGGNLSLRVLTGGVAIELKQE